MKKVFSMGALYIIGRKKCSRIVKIISCSKKRSPIINYLVAREIFL